MAKTARAAIEDLLTCESCHAFYYVERAEDGARTRLRCTSCGHSRDVLLSGAKTNKWTVIDPSGEVKTFTEWDDLVRTMSGSGVTAVRAKLPSDQPISARAVSEAPPAAAAAGATVQRAASERPAPRPSSERPPMHDVQPIGPSVTPDDVGANGAAHGANGASASTAATAPEQEEEKPRPSMSGAALLDVTPNPIAPALSLEDSGPLPEIAKDKESDKSIDIAMSEPNLPAATESKPEALVEALVSSMPDATTAAPPVVEKTADVAPVQAKQEPWDDDEAEVLSMRDIQVVPVAGDSQKDAPKDAQKEEVVIRDSQTSEARNSSTPPPPARGTLRTLPPQRLDAPPPPTITFEEAKKSDPPPKAAPKTESTPPAKTADKAKSEPPKKDTKEAKDGKDTKGAKKPEVAAKPKDASRTATTVPPKSGASAKPATASAKAQAAPSEEGGGRSWLLPAIGVAAAAAVVWYLASGPSNPSQPTTSTTSTATATTAAPESTAKAHDPSTTTTTTTATTATATPTTTTTTTATTTAPTEKAATANVKPADPTTANTGTTATANTGGTTTEKKPANNANLSMSEALDKAGAAKRSGDYASAKDLYARVLKDNPSNVEAHSGLGDIARAQGDLAAAKASYQKALQASPDYGPALLNLADTEWDMGDRASALQRYAKIVAARGGSAPARAKERAGTE